MDLEAPAPAPHGVLPGLKRVLSPVVGAVRGLTKAVSKVLSPPRKQQRPDADDEPARAALDFDSAAAAAVAAPPPPAAGTFRVPVPPPRPNAAVARALELQSDAFTDDDSEDYALFTAKPARWPPTPPPP